MTDILKTIEFIEEVLRESYDAHVMRQMLRKERQRLIGKFAELEKEMMKEAA